MQHAKHWSLFALTVLIGAISESTSLKQALADGASPTQCTMSYTMRECNPNTLRNIGPSPETEPRIPLAAGVLEQAVAMCSGRGGVRIRATANWYTTSPCFNSADGRPPVPAHTSTDILMIHSGAESELSGDECLQSEQPSISATFVCNECGVDDLSIVGGIATFTLTCCEGCEE